MNRKISHILLICSLIAITSGCNDHASASDQGNNDQNKTANAVVDTTKNLIDDVQNGQTINRSYVRLPNDEQVIGAIKRYTDADDNDTLEKLKQDLSDDIGKLPDCLNRAQTDEDRQSCQADVNNAKQKISDFRYRSDITVIKVASIKNYEGNVIAYVDVRTQGDDDWTTNRITLQYLNKQWQIVGEPSVVQ
ncbi:hypothetical protein [Paraburkholderia tropica]|uniref:hypothetical protein n=1 Tax=Paraburkholderia tropica TaxID=92647 RepID=UPI003D2C5FF9